MTLHLQVEDLQRVLSVPGSRFSQLLLPGLARLINIKDLDSLYCYGYRIPQTDLKMILVIM